MPLTLDTILTPMARLPDPADRPRAGTIERDGWEAQALLEPRDADGLTRAMEGEWLAGYHAALRSMFAET